MPQQIPFWKYPVGTAQQLLKGWKIILLLGLPLVLISAGLLWFTAIAMNIPELAQQIEQAGRGEIETLSPPSFPILPALLSIVIYIYGGTKFLRAIISSVLYGEHAALKTISLKFSKIEGGLFGIAVFMSLSLMFFGLIIALALQAINILAAAAGVAVVTIWVITRFVIAFPSAVHGHQDTMATAKELAAGQYIRIALSFWFTYAILVGPLLYGQYLANVAVPMLERMGNLPISIALGTLDAAITLWGLAVASTTATLLYKNLGGRPGRIPTPESEYLKSTAQIGEHTSEEISPAENQD